MSAQVLDRPAMRQVFGPTDVQDVTRKLEKNRWGAFLSARSTISKALQAGGAMAADLAERLHFGGFLRWAQRATGWLLGGLNVVRRVLRTAGVLPGLGWALTTEAGQSLIRGVGRRVVSTVHQLGTAIGKAANKLLGLFGAPGQRLAQRLCALVTKARTAVSRLTGPRHLLLGAGGLLGLVTPVIGAVCRERAVKSLVGRFLTQPWALLARVALNLLLLPASIRREAVRTLGSVFARSTKTATSGVRLATASMPASATVSPVPTSPHAGGTSPLSFTRPPTDTIADHMLEEVPARYPSRPSKNAKRK